MCDLILTHMNKWYVHTFELLLTSYKQEFSLAVISPVVCWKSSRASVLPYNYQWQWHDLVILNRGKNEPERQVNLVAISIALGFWKVPFCDREQVGYIDGEQHRAKAYGTAVASCFLTESIPLIYACSVLSEKYDVNRFKAVPPTPKSKPKVSNKILWTKVSNDALRPSMTSRVTF